MEEVKQQIESVFLTASKRGRPHIWDTETKELVDIILNEFKQNNYIWSQSIINKLFSFYKLALFYNHLKKTNQIKMDWDNITIPPTMSKHNTEDKQTHKRIREENTTSTKEVKQPKKMRNSLYEGLSTFFHQDAPYLL